MNSKISKYGIYAIIALWGVACFTFFHFAYRHHLFYEEQNQLFLLTSDYVATYFNKPAWLACLAGDFLTSLYYYLFAGPAILTAMLLVAGDVLRRSLQKAGIRHGCFFVAIVVMTILAVMSLKTEFRLSSIMAVIIGGALFLCVSFFQIHKQPWCIIVDVIAVAFAHWVAGVGAIVYAILAVIRALVRREPWRWCSLALPFVPIIISLLTVNYYTLKPSDSILYPGVGKLTMPNLELERQLAVEDEYYFGNYEEVERLVESNDKPSLHELFFYNLVSAQKDMLPDRLMKYRPNELGTFEKIGPDTHILTTKRMHELYWLIGDMTYTERAAMLANVFSPSNRNVKMIKCLAETSKVSGNDKAAEKFLRLLDNTLIYGKWAERTRMDVSGKYADKAKMINTKDSIKTGDNAYPILCELLESNPNNTIALDYLLCSDLLLKDLKTFKRDYDHFCGNKPRLKKLYQQALMIYLAASETPVEQWSEYIKDEHELQRFMMYNSHRGDPAFSDTYWYYYDKMKLNK